MKLKYKILMAIIAVSIGLCLMVYQSYALWVVTLSGQENIVSVGCFNIEFIENTSSIALSNSYPVSDEKGVSREAYSFTITNKCTVDSAYQVTLNTLNANTMGDDKVKYSIYQTDEVKPTVGQLVNSATINTDTLNLNIPDLKTSYIIASGELRGSEEENGTGESHTYNVYLWIDENAGNEVENTRFEASINIINAAAKFLDSEEKTATETIIGLAETSDELIYDETTDNNLRYIGANPNNYVSFNNELWRIIGVFNNLKKDETSDNVESKVKIIRNTPYNTNIAWDTNESNDWESSSLQQELNETYYNTIDNSYNTMISSTLWPSGKVDSAANAASSIYSTENSGDRWIGRIGLISVSDYGFASAKEYYNTCVQTPIISWSSSSNCYMNNWLYKNISQWTITSQSIYQDRAFYLYTNGSVYDNLISDTNSSATPVIYLDSNVKITGGDGSESNPFTLSL